MSVWTHVNGNVRFEPACVQVRNIKRTDGKLVDSGANEMLEKHRQAITDILGKDDGSENPSLFWGSEMPIRYSVNGHDQGLKYRFDDKDKLEQLNVSFIGDLRDVEEDGKDYYNEDRTLDEWVKSTIEVLERYCPIRSAVFLIECESSEPYTLTYTWNSVESKNSWRRNESRQSD